MNTNRSQNPGIYIHIPFCRHKCGYCDFYSITALSEQESFVEALCREIDIYAKRFACEAPFDTIYLGGGTPSLLNKTQLERIFEHLRRGFSFADDCEITIEVNPGTIGFNTLQFYKNLGINRLSIGVQSFRKDELRTLERIHSVAEAREVFSSARRAGFDNIGIDLIYALPGQTTEDWRYTLQEAVALRPEHISAYNLTFEEGTPFYRRLKEGKLSRQTEEAEKTFFQQTETFLNAAGYHHYEVSNFARNSAVVSRHNYKYWTHAPYLGFGPSAHSYWEDQRWANVRSVTRYINLLGRGERPVAFRERLSEDVRQFEDVFLRLRTYEGIELERFEREYRRPFISVYKEQAHRLLDEGLAEIIHDRFRLTSKGMMVCDAILPQFITY